MAAGALRSPTVRVVLAVVLLSPVVVVLLLTVVLSSALADQQGAGGPDGALVPGSVPAPYEALVARAGQTCPGISAPLLAAQLEAESGWNPRAVSPVGAQGLAQFMPGTWAGSGLDGDGDGRADPFSPADAIASQAAYMCGLLEQVSSDPRLTGDPVSLALAAYNAGLGAVQRYRGVPPYAETRDYVQRILALTAKYTLSPGAGAVPAGPPGSWVRPVVGGPITSGFGMRWGRLHAGVDIGVPIGTPVYAASAGTVVAAGRANGFGQWVKITHPGGTTTVYGHISAWTVTVGQHVDGGQLIARSGNLGHSSGPHLHFETRPNDQPVDPVRFYAAHGTAL